MGDSTCSRVLIHLLAFISGVSLVDDANQFPIAWSEFSVVPYQRALMSVPPGRKSTVGNILLRFYNGSTPKDISTIPLSKSPRLLEVPGFDAQSPTVLYIHGYIELATDTSIMTVASAYMEGKKDYNFVLLDWSNMAFGQYPAVATRVRQVGEATARQLVRLVNSTQLQLDKLHVVGHSLGAHVAGQIGRSMKREGRMLSRISALDPAFLGFYPALLSTPLRRSDAKYVDVIHTDGGMYGTPLHAGHADFWPNGGMPKQPGCPHITVIFTAEDFCSHYRSWQYWSESVRARKAFPARRCADYSSFQKGDCSEKRTAYMGQDASTHLRGDYYLRTNDKAPFARQLDGIR